MNWIDERIDSEILLMRSVRMTTQPPYSVGQGSWLEAGEAPDLSPHLPVLRLTVLDVPWSGHGTFDDPLRIGWHDMNLWNENVDGTIGMGANLSGISTVFKAGLWYRTTVAIAPVG